MAKSDSTKAAKQLTSILGFLSGLLLLTIFLILGFVYVHLFGVPNSTASEEIVEKKEVLKIDTNFVQVWTAPAEWRIMKLDPEEQKLIKYGQELIAHTSEYLGPKGNVAHLSNGMNCQNCHLNAGTQPWGNNYFAVQANYPKFRELYHLNFSQNNH